MTSFQKEQFGKYLLLDKIGAGGMAEVYTGKMTGDEGFEKLLVIKKILPHLTDEEDLLKSFIDEAKLAALLQHENIIHIYDFGKIDDSYFIAMEHLFGKDLKQVIKRSMETGTKIDLENVLYIISRICDGLDYAHQLKNLQGEALNIIHRDISPQNIFVTYDGHIKIIDFGIAKTALQSTRTQIGFVKGKLAYMSPEQAGNEAMDSRSDIFAAGIILYEMATGKRMFEGETSEIYSRVIEADFEPPENIARDLPPKLIEILYKSLERDPDDRYQSCGEMLSDIEDCLDELSLRPNARKMSEVMTSLFEKELNGEKNQIVEEIKGSELPKEDTVISAQTNIGKPEKTEVLSTNQEDTILENQVDLVEEKEGTVKYSPDEEPTQYKESASKKSRLKPLLFLLCIACILGVSISVLKYKYNNLTITIEVRDNAEKIKAKSGKTEETIVEQGIIEPEIVEPDNSEEINKFLMLAGESLTASKLTTPSDSSAYYYYNEVLKLDPDNVLANHGLEEIANRYALMAERQAKQLNSEKALQYIENGLMVSPDHPGLLSLKESETRKQDNINNLLRMAKESLDAYKLTTPSDTSAYYYYNEVLKFEPENIPAKQGMKEIADRYALLADGQIKQFNYEKAAQYIEKGLIISPGHPRLLSLREAANPNLPKKVINRLKDIFD